MPNDDRIYEFYRCSRWKEHVHLHDSLRRDKTGQKRFQIKVLPNEPTEVSWLTITLSSLSVPPTPLLDNTFLTDGLQTAIAPLQYLPPLLCSTEQSRNLTCKVNEECTCTPAEVRMHCDCRDVNLTFYLYDTHNRFPQLRPNVELRANTDQIIANIPQLPTAEFVLRIKGRFETVSLVSEAICTVEPIHTKRCYKCAKGAQALVTCTSSTPHELAEVRCRTNVFTIPCTSQGKRSKLRFSSDNARFHVNCTVKRGKIRKTFELHGILHYTGNLRTSSQWRK
ncbi:hypothetical protein ANCCEY_03439 [Ancylostoma ceylanicum]|uniref:Phlebovirus glycoprotein G2 fusion domain-containing protein n=2 Tax=Ancylostoma ceylanicum TaxID=53326 RepID=A0A0D6M4Z5_9BILA|nr:hypothetical protein ANCCEY_03439 [Ancylostoma ceylanicum]EYC44532.1 hypothetical protein Y032_0458g1825 [Ancylostoma ceylanicum]